MTTDALPDDWSLLRRWFPEDLNEGAVQHQFFQRARGLQDAEVWLRLILMHVAGGLSLKQTAVRSRELGLAHQQRGAVQTAAPLLPVASEPDAAFVESAAKTAGPFSMALPLSAADY